MYSQAEWPPLDTFGSYLGVAMVTIGGLVTCSIIMVACSFYSFLRKYKTDGTDGGGSGMPSRNYVEEFYSNPAFMNLPFDASYTNPKDLPYNHEYLPTNHHQSRTDKTTSRHPPNINPPKTDVSTITGLAPYQMEPLYYVQGNAHVSVISDGWNSSAIHGAANMIFNSDEEYKAYGPKLTEPLSTDIVFANQGATESFREQEQCSEVLKSIENLPVERNDANLLPHNGVDGALYSPKSDVSKQFDLASNEREEAWVRSYHPSQESKIESQTGLQEDQEKRGAWWNKHIRQSFSDDSYVLRNSSSQLPVKKIKLTNGDFSNSETRHISRRGSSAKKKIRNSFSKVQKPIFHPRRTTFETQTASDIIQNPFVV